MALMDPKVHPTDESRSSIEEILLNGTSIENTTTPTQVGRENFRQMKRFNSGKVTTDTRFDAPTNHNELKE